MVLEDVIKGLIVKELGVKKESIFIKTPTKEDGRFWIDVLDENFDGDLETGDPILESYVLVPISKIQDRQDIALSEEDEEGSFGY